MWRRVLTGVFMLVLLGGVAPGGVQAQLAPEVRDRVLGAAVIIIVTDQTGDLVGNGSGTIIDQAGLILTNYHVVEAALEFDTPLVIGVTNRDGEVADYYLGVTTAGDPVVDLAVVQIVADVEGNALVPSALDLPILDVGDSDALGLGDRLYIVGFPGINMRGLTYTEGIVSGFHSADGITGRAMIATDAVISGGSSGGTAVNSAGDLVGVPTGGLPLDCRPGDTNFDGAVDDRDGGCLATGGAVGLLRPVKLARPLIATALASADDIATTSVAPAAGPVSPPTTGNAPNQDPNAVVPANLAPIALETLVPAALALSPGQQFGSYDGGSLSLPYVTDGFADPARAQQQLSDLGWQEGQYAIFAADDPPPGAAGWVEVHVHRFGSVLGAADGLPLLAAGHQARTGGSPIPFTQFADQSLALAGPAFNGTEATLFARRGNLVFRVTGIAPNGDPAADVIETILQPLVPLATDPRVVTPELLQLLPTTSNLAPGLQQTEVRARSASNTADTFVNPEATLAAFFDWGWLESASAVYEGRTANGSTRFETVVYAWRDAAGAAAAQDYFAASRADALGLAPVPAPNIGDAALAIAGPVDGGTEATVYVRFDFLLIRFTAIGVGDPMADVAYLLGSP